MLPETGLETSLKGQIRVSEVLGRQRFNTAVSWQVQACTKRQLKAAIFKQTEDWSSGKNSLKTSKKFNFCRHYPLSIRGQISCNSFSCFLVKILTKIFLQHVKSFFAKQHVNVTLLPQKPRDFAYFCDQIWTTCNANIKFPWLFGISVLL